MHVDDPAGTLERDALRLAVRALGELAAGPARAKRELLADLLAALCERLGASGGVVAERLGRGSAMLRVVAAAGDAAQHFARGDDLPREAPPRAEALAARAPARAPAGEEAPARLALPLHARGELLGALELERRAGEFTEREARALASFAAAGGELLLGFERAGLRARAAEDLARSQRQLRRSAALDGLTGLATRAASQQALEDAAARSHAAGLPLAVIAFDVDEAKSIAELVGAAGFDEAIAFAARTLRETLRPSDWSGRWGIDTFVVTLLACDADAAALVAERVRLRIEGASHVARSGAEIALTLSAGVAANGLEREPGAQLVARALRALDEAKRAGRNRVCVSRPARD
jgi:diguanylate cyclase (GGDEF)-like protein